MSLKLEYIDDDSIHYVSKYKLMYQSYNNVNRAQANVLCNSTEYHSQLRDARIVALYKS